MADTAGQWHALVGCYGRHRRPAARSNWLLWPTPQASVTVALIDCYVADTAGQISYDCEKTYRQLLYAGVMEVCTIKKNGYPFRETFDSFWRRCVRNRWHNAMTPQVPESYDAERGTRRMCQAIMPASV